MTQELRFDSRHRAPLPSAERHLDLTCPSCQQPIELATGLCGNRLIDAVLLQSERIGAELECRQCGLRFVFARTHHPSLEPGNHAARRELATAAPVSDGWR